MPQGRPARIVTLLALLAAVLFVAPLAWPSGVVLAQGRGDCPDDAVGCDEQPIAFAADGCTGLLGVALDSGWLPSGESEPIQVRFRVVVGGLAGMSSDMDALAAAHVELDGMLRTWWPEPLTLLAAGRRGGGRLTVGYGLEITVQIRLDLEVEGIRIRDTFDIPVPGGLDRFRAEGVATFEPWAFPPTVAMARGESARFTVFEYDALGAFFDFDLPLGIEIPVHGGFRLDLAAFIEGRYQTDQIDLGGIFPPVTEESSTRILLPADATGDYGASRDVGVDPSGTLMCDLGISFIPTLFLEIANFDFEYVIPVDLDLTLDRDASSIDFEPASVHVPLPDVAVSPDVIDVDMTPRPARGLVDVVNEGEAELVVSAAGSDETIGLSPPTFRLAPGAMQTLTVAFTGTDADPASTYVVLRTNDPDRPEIEVGLMGRALPATPPPLPDAGTSVPDTGPRPDTGTPDAATGGDAGPSDPRGPVDEGGCGCRVAGARRSSKPREAFGWLVVLAVITTAIRRRRRARAHR
ncbi:MAG: hypothetical protein IT379_36435 [Deltaproteobacteria bacterium]|nr:hypothetical protein [Deltaproteobacteria bacterium]